MLSVSNVPVTDQGQYILAVYLLYYTLYTVNNVIWSWSSHNLSSQWSPIKAPPPAPKKSRPNVQVVSVG